MKLHPTRNGTFRGQRAFTLVEALITATTLVIVMGSVIACNLFGLAMATRQQVWMGASNGSAQTLGLLMGTIRSAVTMQVGTFTNGAFVQAAGSGQQSGDALMVWTNSGTTPWTLYYISNNITTNGQTNYLVQSNYYGPGMAGNSLLASANSVTNDSTHPIFTEVTCANVGGTLVNTPQSNSTTTLAPVQIYLSFTSLQNATVPIGGGSQYDLYQIIATITPRLLASL